MEKANTEGIKRHRDALRAIVKRIESVKTQIEQEKLESGIQVDKLGKWSAGVEAQQGSSSRENSGRNGVGMNPLFFQTP